MTFSSFQTPLGHSLDGLPAALLTALSAERELPPQTGVPLTRLYPIFQLACQALDFVAPDREKAAVQIIEFYNTDVLCFRNTRPLELSTIEDAQWNPILEWFHKTFQCDVAVSTSFKPPSHASQTIDRLKAVLLQKSSLELAAINACCQITGSCILALALTYRWLPPLQIMELCLLEERYQNIRWGTDEDALARHKALLIDLITVDEFLALLS